MANFGKVLSLSLLSMAVFSGCAKKEAGNETKTEAEPTAQTATQPAEGKSIKIATEGAYKPFNYVDKEGKPQGYDIDIVNALCAEMKAKCEIVTQDWDGIIPGLIAKKYDAIVAGMSITPERQEKVDFTDAYFENQLIYLAKKGDTYDVSTVSGKNIGAQAGTLAAQTLQKTKADKNEVKTYKTQDDVYSDLKAGRLDIMFSDLAPAKAWMRTEPGSGFEQKGEAISNNDQFGIAVRKGDALKGDFNKALATIKENGQYQIIYDNYFK